jgi:hypothetical protein
VDILLICGTFELTWLRMSTTISTLEMSLGSIYLYDSAHPFASLQKVIHLWRKKNKDNSLILPTICISGHHPQDHIFDLVSDFHAYGCTDDRDRIFAVHALSYNNDAHMEIDYDLGVCETFVRFACVCMADGRLRDVLDASIARINVPSAIEVPSWVPDWTRKPGPFTKLPANRNLFVGPMITYVSQVRDNIIKLGVRQVTSYDLYNDVETTFPNLWNLCTEPLIIQTGSSYPTLRTVIRLYQKWDTNHVRNPDSLYTLLQELWNIQDKKVPCMPTCSDTLRRFINHIWDSGVGDAEFSSLEETISYYLQDHCFFEARSSDENNGYFAYGSAGLVKGDQIILAEQFDTFHNREGERTYRGYVIRPDLSVQVVSHEEIIYGEGISYKVVGQVWLLPQTRFDLNLGHPYNLAPMQDIIYLS